MKILVLSLLLPTLIFAMQPGVKDRSLSQIPGDAKRIILDYLIKDKKVHPTEQSVYELLKLIRQFITADKTFQSQLDSNPKVIHDILEQIAPFMDRKRQCVAAYLNTQGTRNWYTQLRPDLLKGAAMYLLLRDADYINKPVPYDTRFVLKLSPQFVNEGDRWGITPLMLAKGNYLAQAFISAGAHVNDRSNWGYTPLMFCANSTSNRCSVARLLIMAGAEVDATDTYYGNTPLMHAVGAENIEMISLLLEAGVLVNFKKRNGKTALDLAREQGNKEVIQMLEKAQT